MSTLIVENLKGPTTGSNANKIIVPSGQELDASAGTLTPSAGAVIQYKNYTGTSYTSISTTNTWTNIATDPTVTITPKFSNSIIVYRMYAAGIAQNCQTVGLRLLRGGSDIFTNDRHSYSDTSTWVPCLFSFQAFDSPSTTSSVTYTVQAKKQAGYLRFNDYAASLCRYYITLEEIKQ